MFSGTLHGPDGSTKFVEDCDSGVLTKTRCGTKERNRKLQGYSTDISDVRAVRILYYSSSGKEKEPERCKKVACGRN